MPTTARHWPLDFTALRKGAVLTTDQLIEIFEGVRPSDSQWSLRVLALRGEIKRHRPDLVTTSENGAIRVLHDVEVPERSIELVRRGLSSLAAATEAISTPVTEELSDAELRLRESTAVAVTHIQQDAMRAAAKQRLTFAAMKTRQIEDGE